MLKLCVFLCLLILGILLAQHKIPKVFEFQQNDYEIDFERIELFRYNKKYVKFGNVITFKYNRTCPVVNATFASNVDLGNDIETVVQAYKFMSNEYRYFPLRFQNNLCASLAKNLMGAATVTKCGNFTGCPIRKNRVYHFCYWTIDKTQFPNLIPNGKYMIELQYTYFEEELLIARLYATVYRPIAVPAV